MPRPRRSFSAEFKDEAVKLVTERGLSLAAAARDLNVGESTLGRWVQAARADGQEPPLTWSEREELARLRRENERLREEKEILKKAAAFFARETR